MISIQATLKRGRFKLETDIVSQSRALGIFGPSGSGKTTVLDALAGLLHPRAGTIRVGEHTYFDASGSLRIPAHRRRIGYVFQDNRLFPHLKVRDNLLFGYERIPPPLRTRPFLEVTQLLGLDPLLERRPSSLSGGEAKRVALGRALLTSPELILLDEPLAGLDAERRRQVLAYLLRIREHTNTCLVYVSHTLSDFLSISDEAAVIDRGQVRMLSHPLRLLEEPGPSPGSQEGLETVLSGSVVESRSEEGFAIVRVGDLLFKVPMEGSRVDDEATLIIRADDVILATDPVPRTSARNDFAGTITRLHYREHRVFAVVDIGIDLYAEITPQSVRELELKEGARVHALLKARSLKGVSLPRIG